MPEKTRAGTIAHSGTYNGNAATMAAGIAALELLTAEQIERLNRLGDRLRARLQEVVNGMGVEAILTGRLAALYKEGIVRGTVSVQRHPGLAKLVS